MDINRTRYLAGLKVKVAEGIFSDAFALVKDGPQAAEKEAEVMTATASKEVTKVVDNKADAAKAELKRMVDAGQTDEARKAVTSEIEAFKTLTAKLQTDLQTAHLDLTKFPLTVGSTQLLKAMELIATAQAQITGVIQNIKDLNADAVWAELQPAPAETTPAAPAAAAAAPAGATPPPAAQ